MQNKSPYSTDYFYPRDISLTGSRCSITSIKKVDNYLWCLSFAAFKSGQTQPIIYDYYVKIDDVITVRRLTAQMDDFKIKIVRIDWNEVEIEI